MYVCMARISPLVSLSADDLAQVVRWEAAPSTPQQVALRCRLVLAAASGKQDLEIASTYDVNRHTAALWRQRVRAAGIGSLWEIQPGRGRKPQYAQEKRDALIAATLETKPKGMTTLFAALSMLGGKVIGQCQSRHRHQEFLKFLRRLDREFPGDWELHLVLDNYGSHKTPEVQKWLKRHGRFVLHFIPTSSSW